MQQEFLVVKNAEVTIMIKNELKKMIKVLYMKLQKLIQTLLKDLSEGYLSKKERKLVQKLKTKIIQQKKQIKTLQEKIKTLQAKNPIPKTTGSITKTNAKKILKKTGPNAQIWLSDGRYATIKKQQLKEFLNQNKINEKKYLKTRHDCDDFSYELMGAVSNWNSHLAFGIIWGRSHAFNFFINENHKVYAVEPQNDLIVPIEKYIKPHEVWLLVM